MAVSQRVTILVMDNEFADIVAADIVCLVRRAMMAMMAKET